MINFVLIEETAYILQDDKSLIIMIACGFQVLDKVIFDIDSICSL